MRRLNREQSAQLDTVLNRPNVDMLDAQREILLSSNQIEINRSVDKFIQLTMQAFYEQAHRSNFD